MPFQDFIPEDFEGDSDEYFDHLLKTMEEAENFLNSAAKVLAKEKLPSPLTISHFKRIARALEQARKGKIEDDWPSDEEMDKIDAPLAQAILDEIESDPGQMVRGEELQRILAEMGCK